VAATEDSLEVQSLDSLTALMAKDESIQRLESMCSILQIEATASRQKIEEMEC